MRTIYLILFIYFVSGRGSQFIGDHIGFFQPGDLVLVGANLPHFWQFDTPEEDVEVYVIHFGGTIWGDVFMNLPENGFLQQLFEEAGRGIQVRGDSSRPAGLLMKELVEQQGSRRLLLLLEILWQLQQLRHKNHLTSIGFHPSFPEAEKDRIHAIYNYTITHFKEKISLQEIAGIAHLSPHSFCKYFKARSKKTYVQFVNEIRIRHACRLLLEINLSVKEICYESGFNNFSSFHQFFRSITGQTPARYQKNFYRS